ncbi:hypothetical protein [Pseudomonas huanghezhanensis]|uniref:hypothetical protein n=1 Tax=Pseudomonas huanghezhanensis TaxID=3002903 RepID=UPI002285F2C0|nr:hypothetical protein [Pseudomonas sp. BSw22131]
MTHNAFKPAPFKLLAPYLPQANKHGIGSVAAASLAVNIDPYPDMDIGDLVELFWGDCYVASKLLTASDIGHTCVLHVPQSFLNTGKVKTYYSVKKIGSQAVQSSPFKLWVKLEPPGGELIGPDLYENQGLQALSFPHTVLLHGLNKTHMSNGIDVSIKAYPNMDAYDEITLSWGDTRIDLPIVTQEDVGQPITFHLPGAFIKEASAGAPQDVTYCVIDRVGNNSMWAPSRTISVAMDKHRDV